MSYSHWCHGQRRISPWRDTRYSPGSEDSTRPVSWPSHRLPPWCGQRLDRAKNSPDRLNSTIARPFTSTSLRPPGAISETAATTCLAISRFHDFLPKLARAFTTCLPFGSIKTVFRAATLHPARSAASAIAATASAGFGCMESIGASLRALRPLARVRGSISGKHAMIDLYALTSPNVQKVFIALEELGLPYKMIPVDVWKGEQYKPEFLKLCPNAKIPVIVDHDGPGGKPFTVFESGAIPM